MNQFVFFKQFDSEAIVCYKMKQRLHFLSLLFIYLNINYVDCQQSCNGSAVTTSSSISLDQMIRDKHKDNQCQFWHYFNPESSKYECYSDPNIGNKVRCKKQGIIELRVGHCMTYEEQERAIYIASCGLTDDFTKNSNGRYIELPVQNVSELNTHMCGPMNRRGRLCSECIEGFGASVISSNFDIMCSNCTGAWYGIPLYLFLEFVPITVFYVIICSSE